MAYCIDVHCHLTGGEYEEVGGVDEVVARAKDEGVELLVCSGFDLQSSLQAKSLAERWEQVYFCAGFHPSELDAFQEGDWEKLDSLCAHEKCVAVGEIGLDYHFEDNPSPDRQRQAFLRQLKIADKAGLPVVIHSRDAASETLEFLRENGSLLQRGGLMHCYSYSAEMLEEYAKLGLYFSFGGPSTFKNAKKVQECVQRVPATRILSETDCPYLTPTPHRGEFPNQPKNVRYVVSNMAILRNEEEEVLKERILQNAKTLFFKIK